MATVTEFMSTIPEERLAAMKKLRSVIKKNLPDGFKERIATMVHYEVPLTTYPDGYHCTPDTPLPFISLANQKNNISIYHMGVYAMPELLEWFQSAYAAQAKYKLNMGKSCIRLKRMDDIPYDVIGELCSKITVEDWIAHYEKALKR